MSGRKIEALIQCLSIRNLDQIFLTASKIKFLTSLCVKSCTIKNTSMELETTSELK